MSAAETFFRELIQYGYSVEVDGERLLVSPRERITDALRQRIKAAKPALLALLRNGQQPPPAPPPLTPDEQADITEARTERAAIMEFDGGLPRHEADAQARRLVQVYRVLVAMDDGQPPRWVTMLGAHDDDDARRAADGTFGAERVLEIRPQDEVTP